MTPHLGPEEGPLRAGLSAYQPLPGVPDELVDDAGQLRPGWRNFLNYFFAFSDDEIQQRFGRGDEYLRDAGVYFRQYGQDRSAEREWPLSHVPVILPEDEWRELSEGLKQRADLLELVARDLYGNNRLVSEGHLPASLIAQNPEWLRPLVGVQPRSQHFLNFIAFEVGRGPGGRWWVLGDRTQAPSGAGFALENRVATSRVFADFYANANVHRLAHFFQAFRDSLQAMRAEDDSQVGILTPGPLNDTYFEHAYIARFLGFALLEGEDLVVLDGRVMVRTVAGPAPISVLFRRLDANFADPLELHEHSGLGTPGLVEAVRRGNVSVVNALGTGVLESRAMLAFLPRVARTLLGEDLRLPNIATWWCGQASERDHVQRNIERMMIGEALSTRLPFDADANVRWRETLQKTLPEAESADALSRWLARDGAELVGQEAVTLSTTPAYIDGQLRPRPMSLRIFLARTETGWSVMPGGFARIGRTTDASAVAMQRGGSVADVWVVSESDVEPAVLLSHTTGPYLRTVPGTLSSRAADNLFWLGRYVERVEGILRLLRAYHVRLAESANPRAGLLTRVSDHLMTFGADTEQAIPAALLDNLASVVQSASHVRDLFSVDGWAALKDLSKTAEGFRKRVLHAEDAARAVGVLLRKINGFSGLVHENMYRFTSWQFLSIGRSLERALFMTSVLRQFACEPVSDAALELAVEVGDSVMTHRRRYVVTTSRNTVIDLLVLDGLNPRSILFHLTKIKEHTSTLPGVEEFGRLSEFARAVLRVHTNLTLATVETMTVEALEALRQDLWQLSDLLSVAYLR